MKDLSPAFRAAVILLAIIITGYACGPSAENIELAPGQSMTCSFTYRWTRYTGEYSGDARAEIVAHNLPESLEINVTGSIEGVNPIGGFRTEDSIWGKRIYTAYTYGVPKIEVCTSAASQTPFGKYVTKIRWDWKGNNEWFNVNIIVTPTPRKTRMNCSSTWGCPPPPAEAPPPNPAYQ